MAYWLVKTEPGDWNWEQQQKSGAKGTPWTGVRNTAARIHMRAMKKGDRAFFYQTGKDKAVVGVVEVIGDPYPDPSDEAWPLVDVAAVETMPEPVTLADVKGEPRLEEMVLVKNSRLSAQPVTPAEWKLIRKMGGLK